jgi:hypothetical protein
LRNRLAAAAMLALAACAPPHAQDGRDQALAKLTARVQALEARARAQDEATVAYLRPTEPEYGVVRMGLGTLALSIRNVSPYANGSQLQLMIGNPTDARLNDLRATLEWGRADKDGLPVGEVFSKEHKFTESVPPGSWRAYTINLSDIPPSELGYVRVRSVEHGSIGLRTN